MPTLMKFFRMILSPSTEELIRGNFLIALTTASMMYGV